MNRSRETSWKYGTRFSRMNDEKEYALFGNESEFVSTVSLKLMLK